MKLFVVVVAVAVVAVAVVAVVVVAVCFCFGGGGRGRGASQLWSLVVSSSVFFSGGRGPVSFFRLACPTFDTCQQLCSVRKGFILSGRDFVRKEFCQGGVLSGRSFVRQEFCQEAGSARKRALPGSGLCQEGESALELCVVFFWGERCEKLEAN